MPLDKEAASPEDITVMKKCLSAMVTRVFLYALDTEDTDMLAPGQYKRIVVFVLGVERDVDALFFTDFA